MTGDGGKAAQAGGAPAGRRGAPGLVLDRYRPTLAELVRGRSGRRARWGLGLLLAAVAVVAVGLAALWAFSPSNRGTEYIHREAPAFNFAYTEDMELARPQGDEYVRVERRRDDGLFLDSFAVLPLRLPAYRGDVGGFLPAFADRELAALRRRYDELELVQEGKTRVVETPGYSLVWRAREGERRLYGRTVLLPEPVPGARGGVRLEMVVTPAAGAATASDAGARGATKRPYRTFRFGTEGP
jgi:hypothetical protein